jgi:hypothetical protein
VLVSLSDVAAVAETTVVVPAVAAVDVAAGVDVHRRRWGAALASALRPRVTVGLAHSSVETLMLHSNSKFTLFRGHLNLTNEPRPRLGIVKLGDIATGSVTVAVTGTLAVFIVYHVG